MPAGSTCSFTFEVNEDCVAKYESDPIGQGLDETVEMFLKSRTTSITISCPVTLADSDATVLYTTTFLVEEIPAQGELRDALEATTTDSSSTLQPIFHIKASAEFFDEVLQEKVALLELAEKEFEEAKHAVLQAKKAQDASNTAQKSNKNPATGKKKTSKKQSTGSQSVKQDETQVIEKPARFDIVEYITANGINILNFSLANRAYLLFGISAAAIFWYGDNASV